MLHFLGSPRTIKKHPAKDPSLLLSRNVQKFLSDNKIKHHEIIARGPLVPFFQSKKSDEVDLQVPRNPFRLVDMDGKETNFLFQTDSIFSRPQNGTADMIFYPEIREIAFTDIPGFGNAFVQMTFDTKFGMRTFFFFLRIYCDLTTRIIIQGSRSGRCD
jgi:hypothetical protein